MIPHLPPLRKWLTAPRHCSGGVLQNATWDSLQPSQTRVSSVVSPHRKPDFEKPWQWEKSRERGGGDDKQQGLRMRGGAGSSASGGAARLAHTPQKGVVV